MLKATNTNIQIQQRRIFLFICCAAMNIIPVLTSQQQQQQQLEEGRGTTQTCSLELQQTCLACCEDSGTTSTTATTTYNCSLPGLEDFIPGIYEGVKANYLSFVTETSTPFFPSRATEFEKCTGGKIVFSEAQNIWQDPVFDLGTKTSRGSEVYDGYFMSYSHFPEVSALGLAEHLNERIRNDNGRLKWEDVTPKVKLQGEYRKDGVTNIDFLMYDGDFFLPMIRLDLLEKHDLPLPNTWEEVVDLAKYFHGTDLNDDGDPDDYGFCNFPRLDSPVALNWWWAEQIYSTWATTDQTKGTSEGFFFDIDTMEPRLSSGFRKAAEIWKDLWTHGAEGCVSDNFVTGRCAVGFAPPGCWKGAILNGISRKDENGTVIWRPTMKNGDYAEPYRFKPFGSLNVVNRTTGELTPCTPKLCPKREKIPPRGHWGAKDKASVLVSSPLEGKLINRAPFYWMGGLGQLIRKSAPEVKKDMLWDFFVYTNSPETSVYDVANYPSWLDSWRYSQLIPGDNFLQGGWSQTAYEEHTALMQWAMSNEINGAFNLRLPGLDKFTRDVMGNNMMKYILGYLDLDALVKNVETGWNNIIDTQGKLDQLTIYRSSLGLDLHSEFDLCRLHRELMDDVDPSTCRKYDPEANYHYIGTALRVVGLTMAGIIVLSSIGLMFWTYFDRDKHIVKVSQPIFLNIICIGTMLMGSSLIPLSLDGEVVSEDGGDVACSLIPWFLSLGWCFSFSALFSKTRRINQIFHNPNKFKRIKVEAKDVVKPMIILLTLNIIVLSVWTALSPPEWDRAPVLYDDEIGIIVDKSRGGCTSEDFWYYAAPLMVVNFGALMYTLQQAFVARKISTEFAESEWIALATSIITLVSFVGVPVMIIASDNTQASYFIQCMLIFAVCMSLLCCIFIPKIRVRLSSNAKNAIRKTVANTQQSTASMDNTGKGFTPYGSGTNLSFTPHGSGTNLSFTPHGSSTIPLSTNPSSTVSEENEGMKVLNHPKLQKQAMEELSDLKVAYARLQRQLEELTSKHETNAMQQESVFDSALLSTTNVGEESNSPGPNGDASCALTTNVPQQDSASLPQTDVEDESKSPTFNGGEKTSLNSKDVWISSCE